MDFLTQAIAWLNDVGVKALLLFVGSGLLKRWPAFVNKAVPFAQVTSSLVLSLLAALFPATSGGPTAIVFASFGGTPLYTPAAWYSQAGSIVANTLIPVAFAIATHSGTKNTAQWVKLGVGLLWPRGYPERR